MADAVSTAPERAHRADKRYIYAWADGHAEGDATMRDLLGGKGAGLAEMTNAGLPVPPGFTITTEACNAYYAAGKQLPPGLWDDVLAHMTALERETGKRFGDPANPLLVSGPVRGQLLDARHDGHRPQPGPQPGDRRGADRAHRNERFGCDALAPLRPDVRPHRARHARHDVRRAVRGQATPTG